MEELELKSTIQVCQLNELTPEEVWHIYSLQSSWFED